MRVLIAEDERPTAEDIKLLVKQILGRKAASVHIETTLDNALTFLDKNPVDVLLLDLNLNAKDGFQILKQVVSKSFHTIVISANIDRAIEAFEYGVLDFIPKPYNKKRIEAAFSRVEVGGAVKGQAIKYLSVKKGYEIKVIPLDEVKYFKSANIYVELHLLNGKTEIYDKSIKTLSPLLPKSFFRIHKSFILDTKIIERIHSKGGGQYNLTTKFGDLLPVSRQKAAELKKLLDL
jgi:DNA-binding LytR/AlgR family response regulator